MSYERFLASGLPDQTYIFNHAQNGPIDAHMYRLEVVSPHNTSRLEEVAALDARIFGEHQSLTAEELQGIACRGLVLALFDADTKKMLLEAQMVTERIDDDPAPLARSLPDNGVYLAGVGVAPEARGRRLARLAVELREDYVRELYTRKEKEVAYASVRAENGRMLTLLTDFGYIGDWYGSYFDTDGRPGQTFATGHRFTMRRGLHVPAAPVCRSFGNKGLCKEYQFQHTDNEDHSVRLNARRLTSMHSLTRVTRLAEKRRYLAHFCKSVVASSIVSRDF